MYSRISSYTVMWIIAMFDLPTETRKERKEAAQFRKDLVKDGFTMFQFSVYIRHCSSMENAEMHKKRVCKMLPLKGSVCLASITDKQFADMEIFYGRKKQDKLPESVQLTLF